jgi:hypothetical protein
MNAQQGRPDLCRRFCLSRERFRSTALIGNGAGWLGRGFPLFCLLQYLPQPVQNLPKVMVCAVAGGMMSSVVDSRLFKYQLAGNLYRYWQEMDGHRALPGCRGTRLRKKHATGR